MNNPLFAMEVAKHLLRGRIGHVASLRQTRTNEFNQLPAPVLTVANQWTGQGRGDARGRQQLSAFLSHSQNS
jgi:hypothetical protein